VRSEGSGEGEKRLIEELRKDQGGMGCEAGDYIEACMT